MKKIALVLILYLICAPSAFARDIYPGTITVEGDKTILVRCALVKHQYVLQDADGAEGTPVATLRQQVALEQGIVSVTLLADYAEIDGKNRLLVLDIIDLKVGKSCHLMDLLNDMTENAEKEKQTEEEVVR